MPRDWKMELAALRKNPAGNVVSMTTRVFLKACGQALLLRQAGGRLYLISVAASHGKPQQLRLEDRHLVILLVNDLADIVHGPSTEEFLALFEGKRPRPRRKISNR